MSIYFFIGGLVAILFFKYLFPEKNGSPNFIVILLYMIAAFLFWPIICLAALLKFSDK